jgi:hypothetical protein
VFLSNLSHKCDSTVSYRNVTLKKTVDLNTEKIQILYHSIINFFFQCSSPVFQCCFQFPNLNVTFFTHHDMQRYIEKYAVTLNNTSSYRYYRYCIPQKINRKLVAFLVTREQDRYFFHNFCRHIFICNVKSNSKSNVPGHASLKYATKSVTLYFLSMRYDNN